MSDFEKHVRQIEEWNEWIAGVLGRFLLGWARIEGDIDKLWLMRVGENKFRLGDAKTIREKGKRLRGKKFKDLVRCIVPCGELETDKLFPKYLDTKFRGSVPGGNLRTWLVENWDTRNLVVHGLLGFRVDVDEVVRAYIADAEFVAMVEAGQAGEKGVFSGKGIDVQALVPLTEQAEQVRRCLMRIQMMVLRNGVGSFPLRN